MSASTSYFAQPVLGRTQFVLIPTTLDDVVPDGHDVRILDELLRGQDWSEWEAEYSAGRGQPGIHPRVVASVILYGLLRRIRSSRVLEYMTGHNVDFMWLTEGRTIDHSTICKFRTRFKKQLKALFRGLSRLAMTMGLIRLGEVTFDGTRVKANNGRYETWTAAEVEKRLAELEAEFGQALEESERVDAAEKEQIRAAVAARVAAGVGGRQGPPATVARSTAPLMAEADAARRREGIKTPAQLPSTDSDSTVLPNKEGGYAPNYTPTAAVDTHRDFIVDADVIADANENTDLVPMVDRVEDALGQRPEAVLADGLNATGPNIVDLEQRGVEFLSPLAASEPPEGNPAVQPDPRQPVPEELWPKLPISPHTKKLDKSGFVFVPEENMYYCPRGAACRSRNRSRMCVRGRRLSWMFTAAATVRVAPLAGRCVSDKNQGGRTITRDRFTPDRERHAAKMQQPEARTRYARRFHAGETPFGWLKHIFGCDSSCCGAWKRSGWSGCGRVPATI